MERPEPSKDEMITLARGPYADTIEKTVAASADPFYWRERDSEGHLNIRNGTVFFVNADRIFAVTADHVFDGYLKARQRDGFDARCQIGNLRIDPENRLIARNSVLDIATFEITAKEIERTAPGKFAMSFNPMVPRIERGVLFVGFPGRERRQISKTEIESGIYTALTVAHSVSDRQIAGHLVRERQVDKPGRPTAPVGYDIAGVSGGPLVTMVDSESLHYWRLGGIMTEFNANLESFSATRADFIRADGTLPQ